MWGNNSYGGNNRQSYGGGQTTSKGQQSYGGGQKAVKGQQSYGGAQSGGKGQQSYGGGQTSNYGSQQNTWGGNQNNTRTQPYGNRPSYQNNQQHQHQQNNTQANQWGPPPAIAGQQQQQQFGGKGNKGGKGGNHKGAGKGGNMDGGNAQATSEQKEKKFYDLATKIAPIICEVIDALGGLAEFGQVQKDLKVQTALNSIPNGFGYKKTVKAVVEKFPDFFSCFEGRVATAKAYELGIVNPNGTLNEEEIKAQKNKVKKAAQVAAGGGVNSDAAKKVMQLRPRTDFPDERQWLNYLCNKMNKVVLVATDVDCRQLFKQIQDSRKKVEELYPKAEKKTQEKVKKEKKEKVEGEDKTVMKKAAKVKGEDAGVEVDDNSENFTQAELIDAIVNVVNKVQETKGSDVTVVDLGNNPGIKAVRKALNTHKFKIGNFVRSFPLTFSVDPSPGDKKTNVVTVLPGYTPYMDQDCIRYFSEKEIRAKKKNEERMQEIQEKIASGEMEARSPKKAKIEQ